MAQARHALYQSLVDSELKTVAGSPDIESDASPSMDLFDHLPFISLLYKYLGVMPSRVYGREGQSERLRFGLYVLVYVLLSIGQTGFALRLYSFSDIGEGGRGVILFALVGNVYTALSIPLSHLFMYRLLQGGHMQKLFGLTFDTGIPASVRTDLVRFDHRWRLMIVSTTILSLTYSFVMLILILIEASWRVAYTGTAMFILQSAFGVLWISVAWLMSCCCFCAFALTCFILKTQTDSLVTRIRASCSSQDPNPLARVLAEYVSVCKRSALLVKRWQPWIVAWFVFFQVYFVTIVVWVYLDPGLTKYLNLGSVALNVINYSYLISAAVVLDVWLITNITSVNDYHKSIRNAVLTLDLVDTHTQASQDTSTSSVFAYTDPWQSTQPLLATDEHPPDDSTKISSAERLAFLAQIQIYKIQIPILGVHLEGDRVRQLTFSLLIALLPLVIRASL